MPVDRVETIKEYSYGAGSGNAKSGADTHILHSTDPETGNPTQRPVDLSEVPEGTPRTVTVKNEGMVDVAIGPSPVVAANLAAREAVRPKKA